LDDKVPYTHDKTMRFTAKTESIAEHIAKEIARL